MLTEQFPFVGGCADHYLTFENRFSWPRKHFHLAMSTSREWSLIFTHINKQEAAGGVGD